MQKKIIYLCCVCFFINVVPSYSLELYCTGEFSLYENGFGANNNKIYKIGRPIEIDTKRGTIKAITFFGTKTTKYNLPDDLYSADFKHEKNHGDSHIVSESISINRYTGDIHQTLVLSDGAWFSSFDGKCKKQKKLF